MHLVVYLEHLVLQENNDSISLKSRKAFFVNRSLTNEKIRRMIDFVKEGNHDEINAICYE